jgi:endonuclease/exonuclease/phosphatase (EEP) superfamily protein YafD
MDAVRGPLRGIGWVVVAGLVGIVLLRLVGLESRSGFVFSLVALTPWLLLLAWIVLGAAVVVRDRVLLGAAVVLVLLQVAWVAPDGPWAGDPASLDGREPIRVVSSNASDHNLTPQALAAALLAEEPDVLVVVEHSPEMAQALEQAGLREQLPNAAEDPRSGTAGSAIFTRLPMADRTVIVPGGTPMVTAMVELDGVATQVVAVHTTQPLVVQNGLDRQLGALAGLVGAADHPVVLAGDFNANTQTAGFRSILEAGATDAHRASGRGWARSWPATTPFPVLLLDHVVATPPFEVVGTAEGQGWGSDHRYVVADLVVGH